MFQGSTKLSPVGHMIHGIFILVQKECNVKKESFSSQNLKDCLPSLPLKQGKKKKIKSF
jgi:hypothetical protein